MHRANAGDRLCVGLLNGPVGTGTVAVIDHGKLEMDVQLDQQPPVPLPVTLILALPRPKVLKRVLRSMAALGVKKIILLNACRVEKSYWSSPMLSLENMMQEMTLGLEQARDTIMPEILLRMRFKPFVEDELQDVARDTLALAAHPASPDPCPRHINRPITLVVGPEGGFIPYEAQKLAEAGFRLVNLGERILSVETAVPVLLSRLI